MYWKDTKSDIQNEDWQKGWKEEIKKNNCIRTFVPKIGTGEVDWKRVKRKQWYANQSINQNVDLYRPP